MNRRRFQDPDRLPGAADFSDDESLRGSLNAVKLVKSQKWVWDGLREACDLEVNYARRREPGDWSLAAVAFVASGHVDVRPWRDETTDELWSLCGFEQRPSYSTTWRRLAELESICEEFLNAAALVIQRCKMHDDRVFAHSHVDWTEQETHARLIHDCQPGEDCKKAAHGSGKGSPRRVSTSVARESRQAMNTRTVGEAEEMEKQLSPTESEEVTRNGRRRRRVRVNDCWYITRDFEAGIRSYAGPSGASKRFWHGYYSGKFVDHYTGGVIPSVDSASRQEYRIFPELFDQAKAMIGEAPETVTADRGLAVIDCYFSKGKGKPRLWFRCMIGLTDQCKRDQTISCSTDWRRLVPLAKTEPLYQELADSHQTYEATHDYWRDRFRVGGDCLAHRAKRVSIGSHRLRANVACLIDWLRIGAKNGWLGSTRSKTHHKGQRRFKQRGIKLAAELLDNRAFLGLQAPYGPAAIKAGFLQEKPPSDRPPPILA